MVVNNFCLQIHSIFKKNQLNTEAPLSDEHIYIIRKSESHQFLKVILNFLDLNEYLASLLIGSSAFCFHGFH